MESKLKVSIDGSQAAGDADKIKAALDKMSDAGSNASSIFNTLTNTLSKMGASTSTITSLNASLQVMGSAGAAAAQTLNAALNQVTANANAAAQAIGGGGGGGGGGGIVGALAAMGNAASGIGGFLRDIFSIEAIFGFAKTIFDVSNRLQGFISTMSVVTGSAITAREELNSLFLLANKWGADVDSLTSSYAKLSAAAKGTTLEGQGVKDIFEAITQASVALHLSTQDTGLVFFALQQMVSKGKVSMEELRKQMAERFPGAIQIAADSLGMTTDAMEKMIRKGELLAQDFLPKFAQGIKEAFGDAAVLASHSLLAEINRLKNAWEAFLLILAESGVIKAASETVQLLTTMLTGNNDIAQQVGESLTALIGYVNQFLSSLTPESVGSFFNQLIDLVNITITLFGQLVQAIIWTKDNLGFVGTAIGYAATAVGVFSRGVDALISLAETKNWATFMEWFNTPIGSSGAGISAVTKVLKLNENMGEVLTRLNTEKERGIAIDSKALKNAQNTLADSERAVGIKTKEISLTTQLNALTTERVQLQKIVNDGSVTDRERTTAITQLIAVNKDYAKVKAAADKEAEQMSKAAIKDLKQQWSATESLTKSLETQQYALTHTREEEELRAAAIAVSTIRNKADREAMFDRLSVIITTNSALRRQQEEEKAIQKIYEDHIGAYDKQIDAADKSLQKAKEENEQIGKSKSEIQNLKAARLETAIATLQATLATVESTNACTEEAEKIKTLIERLKELQAVEKDSANKFADFDFLKEANAANKKVADDFRKTADSIGDSLTDALLRGFEKGGSFAENFKTTLINMFKTMVLKPIIQPILTDIVSGFTSLLGLKPNPNGGGFTFGGGGGTDIGGFFGGPNKGGDSSIFDKLSSMFTKSFNNSVAGKYLSGSYDGNNDPNMGPIEGFKTGELLADGFKSAIQGAAIGSAVGGIAAQVFGNERNKSNIATGATIGGSIGMIFGPIGALIGAAIGALIGSFIKNGGGPKGGGYYASGDTRGISGVDSTGRWFTPSTQDKAVKEIVMATTQSYSQLLRNFGGTGHASFALGFDTDPKGTAPNRTHAGVFMGGRQIYDSQQSDLGKDPEVLKAALETESKKALIAALQASELPQYLAKILDGVNVGSLNAETADNILHVLTALDQLSDIFGGLSESMANMDQSAVEGLISAFGGFEDFAKSMAFLSDNFVSSAEKQTRAQKTLDTTFGELGIAVPKTHQAFLDLLASIDVTTVEGQNLYATISSLAPAFVVVNGTADQAAEAITHASEALDKLADKGQQFFDEKFLTDSEKSTSRIAGDWAMVQTAWTAVGGTLMELGLDHIPTTNKAFKDLIVQVKAQYGADSQLYKILIALSPSIWDLNGALEGTSQAVQTATDFFNNNFFNDATGLSQKIDVAWGIVHAAWTEMGGQLLELGYHSIPTTNAGFRDMIQNLRSMGMNELADKLILLAPVIFGLNGNIADLAKLSSGAADSVNALNAALERSQQAAAEAQSAFNTVWNSIEEIVNGSGGSFADKLALKMKLIPEQMAKIEQQIEDEMARGGIYSPLLYALKEMLSKLGVENDKAKKELERFTILSAKYGDAKAEQLVQLEEWYEAQQTALAGSTEALAALTIVFNEKWKGIIDGTKEGGEGVQDALEGILKSIREFIKGLLTSDLSPLTPRQKLDEARAQYEADLALAKGGDTEALGRLTSDADTYLKLARDFYASAPAYTEIFNSVVEALKAISNYNGTGPGTDVSIDPVKEAMPVGAKIASAADIDDLGTEITDSLGETIGALATVNDVNTAEIVRAIERKMDALIEAVGSSLK